MKVILNKTVPKVGKEGDVVNVSDGYARNYLFARGLAVLAEKNQLDALQKKQARMEAKTAGQKNSAEDLKEKLDGKEIRIQAKVGAAAGKLFGAVTSQDVADAIKDQLKISLEKKQIAMVEPIKRLGKHQVMLDLHRSVDAHLTVDVFDPNAPVEPTVREEYVAPAEELEPATA